MTTVWHVNRGDWFVSKRVIVIGGGVIGTACAYYLQQSGCDVTIVEQKTIGSGASHANCGFVCPSHVLPLAGPGVMGKTLKAMLSTNSPLDRKSTRLNSSHIPLSRMPSSA